MAADFTVRSQVCERSHTGLVAHLAFQNNGTLDRCAVSDDRILDPGILSDGAVFTDLHITFQYDTRIDDRALADPDSFIDIYCFQIDKHHPGIQIFQVALNSSGFHFFIFCSVHMELLTDSDLYPESFHQLYKYRQLPS